jgi:hypothetical protein
MDKVSLKVSKMKSFPKTVLPGIQKAVLTKLYGPYAIQAV